MFSFCGSFVNLPIDLPAVDMPAVDLSAVDLPVDFSVNSEALMYKEILTWSL